MKRKGTLMVCFVLMTVTASAQNLMFRIGGGLASHYNKETKNVGAFKFGVGYEFEMTGMWSIEPCISFYAKGWKEKNQEVNILDKDGNQVVDPEGNEVTGQKNVSSTANYIELPILFHYYYEVKKHQYMVLTAGPYIAYGIGGKMETKGDAEKPGVNKYYYATKTFEEKGAHRLDAGIQLGVGFEYNRSFGVGIEADFGLLNASRQQKNMSALLTLRYRLPLSN
ncbi:MAG: porin family protein [Bacteroidaceae bacterium]